MAVVNVDGPLYMTAVKGDPVNDGRADFRVAGARIMASTERFTVTVGDEVTSTYSVGRVPRDAVLVEGCTVRIDGAAVTGTFDLGAAGAAHVDKLLDGVAGAVNTTYPFAPGFGGVPTTADAGKPLWELLGFASRSAAPQMIDLLVTLVGSTQATANARGLVTIKYTYT